MVAVAHPSPSSRTGTQRAQGLPLDRQVGSRVAGHAPFDGRRHLRLVVDNGVEVDQVEDRPSVLPFPPATAFGLAVAALVIFGGFFLLRMGQGPAEADAVGAADPSVGAAASAVAPTAGDLVIVAKPGDTLWSVALRVAPDSDPRPVVEVLVSANGGEEIRAGQQIIVPEQLLD